MRHLRRTLAALAVAASAFLSARMAFGQTPSLPPPPPPPPRTRPPAIGPGLRPASTDRDPRPPHGRPFGQLGDGPPGTAADVHDRRARDKRQQFIGAGPRQAGARHLVHRVEQGQHRLGVSIEPL